ncbi:MAG: YceI family protein [Candidatus Binatia bacterium]|nr:YceI family protein [Candidatus Binatia bacterium]
MTSTRTVRCALSCFLVSLFAVLGLASAVRAADDAPPGYVRFVGENTIATANGEFKRWKIVKAEIDPNDPAAGVVEIEIDVASLDTDNQKRDDHLRNPDFFEVEKFSTATVRVHNVRKGDGAGSGKDYDATFDVKIHGVAKSVEGKFAVVSTSPPIVEGKLVLDRMDFGVGQPHSAVNPMSIGQEIPVTFRAELPAG